MTNRRPPRLPLALLERFVPDSSSLAGDLIEEFDRRQSRASLWWQVLAAIAIAWFKRTDEIRPLQLVDLQPSDALERSRALSLRFPPVNLTASPVHGIGGLGLVVLLGLITVKVPAVWWVYIASVISGVGFGLAMIAMHRSESR